jgi:alkanesulfonate monooxygenase SsuD/methylene tetrahydromethanopterin reductase-like flavin-dependent oxidoreductase (luciferase family)
VSPGAATERRVIVRFGIGFFFNNYGDWDRFEALERGEPVGPMAFSDAQLYREELALADLAEPLGFDTLWTFEQHGSPYLMIPDPHQWLTYMAARTSRIDFGSMITVLPWHNPVRLAEQISMLQHFMGPDRQYFMGVGRGLARRNFEAMGVSMDTARERFNEVLDVLQLAFTQEIFSYHGEFFDYDCVSVRPRPLRPAEVIEAWGTWTSEPSVRNMGARGLHPMTTPNKSLESYREDLVLLNELREQHGYGPANQPILQVPLYCCESEQQAIEDMEYILPRYVDSINRQYEIGTERFGHAKGFEQYTSTGSDFGTGTKEDAIATLSRKFLNEGIIGTPEQCAEKVVAHHESVDPSELVGLTAIGPMTAQQAEKSMRLYAEKVLPKVAHLRKESALAR